MKVRLEAGRHSFSIRLALVMTLSLIVVIGGLTHGILAQTDGFSTPEKAPPGWDQQFWTNERNTCKALFKDSARYQSMTAEQRAQVPGLSRLEVQRRADQLKFCMSMAPHPSYGLPTSPSNTNTLPPSPLQTPTPQPTPDDSSLIEPFVKDASLNPQCSTYPTGLGPGRFVSCPGAPGSSVDACNVG